AVAPRRAGPVLDSRSRLWPRSRSRALSRPRPRGDRPRRRGALRRHGTRRHRVRRLAPGLPGARPAARALRRDLRQRLALPRSRAGVASRPSRAPRDAPAARRPLRVEPTRTRHRGLAGGAPRRRARSRHVAMLRDGGGLRRARPLLPPAGTAARPATVARDRLAEGLSHGTEAGSPAARGASSARTTTFRT